MTVPSDEQRLAQHDFAPFSLRLTASLIDGFVLSIPSFVLLIASTTAAAAGSSVGTGLLLLVALIWWIFGPTAYYTVLDGGPRGQTFGKQLVGIHVVDQTTGESIGYARGLGRTLARVLSGIPLYLGYLWMLRDPNRQTWHDKIVGSYVVRAGSLVPSSPSSKSAPWRAAAKVGVQQSNWESVPGAARRALAAILWVSVGLVLIALFGVWKTSALAAAGVVLVLVAPRWGQLIVGKVRVGKWIVSVAVFAIVVVYPFYGTSMPQLPIFGPFPQMSTMVGMAVFTMMALGLNFVVGYAGLLDLGYVAFYAMGSYMAGWFASSQFAKQNIDFGAIGVTPGVTGFHFSIWLVLLMAGIATAVIGVIIGLPTLRLRGDYLAIVTLGFGEIMPQIARNGDNLFGTGFNLTNGTGGITPIDGPGFGGWIGHHLHLPANYLTLGPNADRAFFWTALVLVLLTIFCSARLRDSRLGRAWIAIREDEVAAAAMGVPLMRTKTWAYATGAFFGGVAGAYYASYNGGAFPDEFFFNISVFILCMVILGGMGNIWGVIFGACFLEYLDREGLANVGAWINTHFGTHLDVPLYEFGIFGVILVVVMLFRPEGLIPSSRRAAEFHEGVHDEPLYDVAT